MTKKKPKRNYKPGPMDNCQTPPYAFDLLQPFLPPPADNLTIWEPAAGDGHLAKTMRAWGYNVFESDLQTGQDFFEYIPDMLANHPPTFFEYMSEHERIIIVTNPPYSIKKQWQARCFKLRLPFALLMPAEFLFTNGAIKQYEEHGNPALIVPDRRMNFGMPGIGWTGSENREACLRKWQEYRFAQLDTDPALRERYPPNSEKRRNWLNSTPTAQFPVSWYTHGLNLRAGTFTFKKLQPRPYYILQPEEILPF